MGQRCLVEPCLPSMSAVTLHPTHQEYFLPNDSLQFTTYVLAKSFQLFLTLCNPTDCCLRGSSLQGILQATVWSGLPYPVPGAFLTQGLNPISYISTLAGRLFTTSSTLEFLPSLYRIPNNGFGFFASLWYRICYFVFLNLLQIESF